jgi:hypothetical protein
MPMHQLTPLLPLIEASHRIDARRRIDAVESIDVMAARQAQEDAEEAAWDAAREAEFAAKERGCAYAMTCFKCRHLPPDDRLTDPDSLIRAISESKRISRLILHAREGCETCPYLPENYGKPVRARVLGLDDWEDDAEVDRVRRARFDAWEAQHGSR